MSYPDGVTSKASRRRRRCLIWGVLLATGVGLVGCGLKDPRLGRGNQVPGNFQWAAEDTSRLIRNAHYFKLMGQPELALKEMEEVHRQAPGNLKITDALAQYCDELGLHDRAQQIYREGLALDPDNAVFKNNLGFSYYLSGNYPQAEACYRKTLERQPNYAAARNNLGLLLCRQGRQAEARQLWQQAEGEAGAAQKMTEALNTLGLAGDSRYAQESRPYPEGKAVRPDRPAGRPAASNVASAAASPKPFQAPSPAKPNKVASRPLSPDPITAGGPIRLAKTPPPPSPQAAAAAPGGGQISARPLPPHRELAAAKPMPMAPPRETAAPKPAAKAEIQPGPAPRLEPKISAGQTAPANAVTRRLPITARELIETNIAVLNGNGLPDLAHDTRSRLSLEGLSVASIANYRDFGVDRTVIYYRPDAKNVATLLNNKFFPNAEIKPAPQLADNIDVKVILGHDLLPQQHAEAVQSLQRKRL